MKLLHTSDWHLGHVLYNYDRHTEQEHMLAQIVDIVKDERPDIFLLCGDIYHTAQPSATVQRLFADTMVEIHSACPEMQIFVTAGNHDSASRHDIFTTPWRALNVTTVGNIDSSNPESLIHEVSGKCFVIAVPYCHERNMPENLFQTLLDRVDEMNPRQLPVVMMAHTTVSGCDFKGHEEMSETMIGGIDSVTLNDFGTGYDYLALGHIHHAQTIRGSRGKARYSGSPLAVSFDEEYPHSVSIVEIPGKETKPEIREVQINNIFPLISLPAEGYSQFEEALESLKIFPDDMEAYIRLNVEISDFLPHLAREEALAAVREKKCRFCHINAVRKNNFDDAANSNYISIGEFKKMSPTGIAEKFATEKGFVIDDDLKELLKEIIESVNEEERE